MFRKSLFGKNIDPACEYCSHSEHSGEGGLTCSRRRKAVQAFEHCSAFSYDPLRRIPHRQPQLPHFDPDEFKL